MSTEEFQVTGMMCAHCTRAVTVALTSLPGVTKVSVSLDPTGASTVTVEGDPVPKGVGPAITKAGYAMAPPAGG